MARSVGRTSRCSATASCSTWAAIAQVSGDDRLATFTLGRAVVLLIVGDTVTTLAGAAPGVAQAISSEAYFDTAPAYMDFAAWIGLPQAFAP